ncbi:MAG: cytochrome c biogenesis protein CcdA [Actinobacteria bacterium]|nr:cytochrome c biogenesis protein CcdA [Actinomycetota bacterium]
MSPVALAVAFAGGMVSFLSPCVLALVPGYLAFISGISVDRLDERPGAVLVPTLAFVAAFAALFTLLGASLGAVSTLLDEQRRPLEIAGGVMLIAFGLLIVAGPRLRLLQTERRPIPFSSARGRTGGAALAGLAFGIGWTPCIGPVLAAVLTYAATAQSAWGGAALLFTYALGLGVPFIVTSLATRQAMRTFRRFRRAVTVATAFGAVGMVAMGLLVASGKMQLITTQLGAFNRFG